MRLPSKGQTTIELAIVFILVIVGIIVGGPYVLRSIQAHFKLWDESVDDSFTSKTIEARPDQIDKAGGACVCQDPIPGGCGLHGCKETERLMVNSCLPLGCNTDEFCQDLPVPGLPDCCSTPLRTTVCWRSNADTPNLATIIPPVGFTTSCSLGDRVFQYKCGTSAGMQVCQQDWNDPSADFYADRDCRPVCNLSTLPKDAGGNLIAHLCPGAGTALNDDLYPNLLHGSCPAPASPSGCDASCDPGYIYSNNFCTKCGDGHVDPGEACDSGPDCIPAGSTGECTCPIGTTPDPSGNGCIPACVPAEKINLLGNGSINNTCPSGPRCYYGGTNTHTNSYVECNPGVGCNFPTNPPFEGRDAASDSTAVTACNDKGYAFQIGGRLGYTSGINGNNGAVWKSSNLLFGNCLHCGPITQVYCSNYTNAQVACAVAVLFYRWVEQGNWNACTAACGTPGVETQMVFCQEFPSLASVDSSLCPKIPPADTRPCTAPCVYTYSWKPGNTWSDCSNLCGNGTQTQSVSCQRTAGIPNDEITVADSFCDVATRPSNTQACSSTVGC